MKTIIYQSGKQTRSIQQVDHIRVDDGNTPFGIFLNKGTFVFSVKDEETFELLQNVKPRDILNNVRKRSLGSQSATGGDATFVYNQNLPSDTWIIEHTLNKFPSVTVVDSAGSEVVGKVFYIDDTHIKITFSGGFSGKAYLN